jgi:hypothetical protein
MSNNEPGIPEWPTFEPMFTPPPGRDGSYLDLLNLGRGAAAAIRKLRDILDAKRFRMSEIDALLADVDWRPQLVAAVALAIDPATQTAIPSLWSALGDGSWVAPQLAAVLSISDPEFEENARQRIDGLCRIEGSRWLAIGVPASEAGPGSINSHSAKALAALIALCEQRREWHEWLHTLTDRADVKEALAKDFDGGGSIAIRWLKSLQEILSNDVQSS